MAEQQRVSARVSQLQGEVDDNATGDAVAIGVGLILFWPALFFIDGDGSEANEGVGTSTTLVLSFDELEMWEARRSVGSPTLDVVQE